MENNENKNTYDERAGMMDNDNPKVDGEYNDPDLFSKDKLVNDNQDNMATSEAMENEEPLPTENSYDEEESEDEDDDLEDEDEDEEIVTEDGSEDEE